MNMLKYRYKKQQYIINLLLLDVIKNGLGAPNAPEPIKRLSSVYQSKKLNRTIKRKACAVCGHSINAKGRAMCGICFDQFRRDFKAGGRSFKFPKIR